LAIEAVALLPPCLRPVEVHLLAAATAEADVAPHLASLTRIDGNGAFFYFSRRDEVLTTAYRIASGRSALGCTPLSSSYGGRCTSVDCTNYFGLLSHNKYKSKFFEMRQDAFRGRAPPPPALLGDRYFDRSRRLREQVQRLLPQLAKRRRAPTTVAPELRLSYGDGAGSSGSSGNGSAETATTPELRVRLSLRLRHLVGRRLRGGHSPDASSEPARLAAPPNR